MSAKQTCDFRTHAASSHAAISAIVPGGILIRQRIQHVRPRRTKKTAAIYPIVDVASWSFSMYSGPRTGRRDSVSLASPWMTMAYHTWWLQPMKEAEIPPLSAELNELKEIDSGIWALGRAILKQAKDHGLADDEPKSTQRNANAADAGSPEKKIGP